MKEIRIFFDSYFVDKIQEEIKEYGIKKYMMVPRMFSEWSDKLKHFDNHLWPGTDSMIIIFVPDEQAEEIMNSIRIIRNDAGDRISMGAVLSDVHEVLF